MQGIANCIEVPTDAQDFSNAVTPALETSNRNPADLDGENTFKILLAEDNVVNQKVALKFLESAGHRVSVVENGALAVEAVKKHDYDLQVQFDLLMLIVLLTHTLLLSILMDVSMPFMGGIEATNLIRRFEEQNGLERVPIIALTAHAMLGDREKW